MHPIRPISKLVTVAVLILLMRLLASLVHGGAPEEGPADTATILGFLLLAAFLTGKAAGDAGLPRVTGYILLGLIVGPGVLGVVTDGQVERLDPVNDIAISLIALSAGGELRLEMLRERGREILGIIGAEMIAVFVALFGLIVLLSGALPFTAGRDWLAVLTIAMIFGSIAVANSPSVTIAVINETRARGPLSSTILGVTVAKDVIVVVGFAVAVSAARSLLGDTAGGTGGTLGPTLLREVGGSLLLGVVLGWLISLYLHRVAAEPVLFVLGAAFVNALLANALHVEALLVSLVAGLVVVNVGRRRGPAFVEAVESNSLVFYALFFSLAGAHIRPFELVPLLPLVGLFVLVRAGAVWLGTRVGATWSGAPPTVRRYAWVGFISQAGVTLGMVSIVVREFPAWGGELYALFLAMVAVHELVGPVLLKWGLSRAGETGARDRAAESGSRPVGVTT